jgi:hypothetical protein
MKKFFLWSIPAVVLAVIAILYFWPERQAPEPQFLGEPVTNPEPAIRHPIESADAPKEPLPQLAESDDTMRDALAALLGNELPKFVRLKNIIHRIVATVDNLPRDHVAPQLMPVTPTPGVPITVSGGEDLALSAKNAQRYQRYVRFADAVPTDGAVQLYVRFYPLFQEQYENLGYPGTYFNDRVVEVIDHLIATPEIEGPLGLVQPKVLYEFADPKLEQLSAGQKILLRIGRANADKVKAKLREIRQALVSLPPQ